MRDALLAVSGLLSGALLGSWVADPSWVEPLLGVAVAWVLAELAGWGPR